MKSKLKNLAVPLFLLFNISIHAQSLIPVEPASVFATTQALKAKFQQQIPVGEATINSYLSSFFLQGNVRSDFSAPAAQLTAIDPINADFSFSWPAVPGSTDYTVSWLNLHTGLIGTSTAPDTFLTVAAPNKTLHLFAFQSNSPTGKSTIDIMLLDLGLSYIIIDKDIFLRGTAECPDITPVEVSFDRSLEPSFHFEIDANCNNTGRYFVEASRIDRSGTKQLSIYRLQFSQPQDDTDFNYITFEPVTDGVDYDHPFLAGKADAYEFILTNEGVQVVFPGQELDVPQLQAWRCTCPAAVRSAATSLDKGAELAQLLAWPNPFGASTVIEYQLSKATEVAIYLSSPVQPVRLVLQHPVLRPAGNHQLRVDGSNWPAGFYTCTIKTAEHIQQINLIKVR
ncbi:MAG: hypothetical protein AAGG75_17270 [Bacteroidota bacterium]